MIITVTLNAALDKTAFIDEMKPYALNRLQEVKVDAGGKGINVSAIIHSLGGRSIATGFAGGSAGEKLLSEISTKGLEADFIRIEGNTRTNLKVIDHSGQLTELNEPGPVIKPEEWSAMEQKLSDYGVAGNIVVLSGSLPTGLADNTYQKLSAILRRRGAEVFLDADGKALELALSAPPNEIPDSIKPNRHELLRYFGIADHDKITEKKWVELCLSLLDKGIKLVALSMGEAGALFVNKKGIWRSKAIPVSVRSSVGAGDSMCGALAYGFEKRLEDEQKFALAMAASAAACTTEGTKAPERALIAALSTKVSIEKFYGNFFLDQ